MPYAEFLWMDENVDHIAEHDVTTDEFEHVVRHPDRPDVSHSSGLPCCWGTTPVRNSHDKSITPRISARPLGSP